MEQRGRAKILLGIPPLGRARCGAAGAEDALMWLAFDLGISFLSCCGRSLRFNDGSTLLYSGDLLERRDHGCSPRLRLDLGEAGEPVVALDEELQRWRPSARPKRQRSRAQTTMAGTGGIWDAERMYAGGAQETERWRWGPPAACGGLGEGGG
jgi:hypothetical protein